LAVEHTFFELDDSLSKRVLEDDSRR